MTYSVEWLAGLITGEGCFTLSVNQLKQSRGEWLRIIPVFALTMTDLEVMQDVAESFRAYDLPVYMQDRTAQNTRRERRPTLALQVNGIKRVHRVAGFFVPHLGGNKKLAAETVRDYCEHRLTRHSRGIDDRDISFIERIREINGTNGVTRYSVSNLRDYKLGRANKCG